MDQHTAQKLINKTRDDYNLIAEQFASTRHYVWGDFAKTTKEIDFANKKVLDLGCGNGRIFEFLTDKKISGYFGIDQSEELVKIAKNRYPEGHFIIGNILETPYKNEQFDIVICLATLHHVPTGKLRNQAIGEIYRILKPGGILLMTNWYFWNKPKYLKMLVADTSLPFGDFMMPWKLGTGKKRTERYFHAWTKAETKKRLRTNGFEKIKLCGFKHNIWYKIGPNLIATAKKPVK